MNISMEKFAQGLGIGFDISHDELTFAASFRQLPEKFSQSQDLKRLKKYRVRQKQQLADRNK